MSSPYYTSPSGGNSRWYSPDNTQYGQIYTSGASNSIYNFIINPAYKLGLTMNTQGASNPGAVNSVYTQGCDIGWNYNGNGSTDFYNNAGLQPTTTHQAFTFWDASTILIQQVIAFLPRIQGSFGATGLSMPTYDWVNGTVSAAISAIPSLNSFNMTAIVPAATNTYYGLWANSATTGSHPIDTGTYVQLVPNTNTISITSNLNVLTTNTSLNNVRTTSTPIILAFGNCDGSASGGADAFNLTSSYLTSTGWTNPSGGLYELTLTGVSHSIFSATITGNAGTSTAGQRPQILTSVAYIGGFTNAYLSVKFQIYYLQGTGGGGAPFNGPFSYSISGIMN